MSTDGYFKVPHSVARDATLSLEAFRVYVVVGGHIHREAWSITLKDLALECGIDERTVRKHLPTLAERYGLCYEGGRGRAYRFWWGQQTAPDAVQTAPHAVQTAPEEVQTAPDAVSPGEPEPHAVLFQTAPDAVSNRTPCGSVGTHIEPIEPNKEPSTPRRSAGARAAPTPPDIPKLSLEFSDLWTPEEVQQRCDEALNHQAAKRWTDMTRYCRNWMRKDATPIRERRRRDGEHGGRAEASAASSRQQPGVGGGNRPPSAAQGSRGGPQHPAAGLGFSRRNR